MISLKDLEKTLQESYDVLNDGLELMHLNIQTLKLQLVGTQKQTQSREASDLLRKIEENTYNLTKICDKRPEIFLNYMIIQQIQDQENSVRKQRLIDYQDKIYDQRRVITDKETFYEGLLRPKLRRPKDYPHEAFQLMRQNWKAEDEKQKIHLLESEIEMMQQVRKSFLKIQKQTPRGFMSCHIDSPDRVVKDQKHCSEELKSSISHEVFNGELITDDDKENVHQSKQTTHYSKEDYPRQIVIEDAEFCKCQLDQVKRFKLKNSNCRAQIKKETEMGRILNAENLKLLREYEQLSEGGLTQRNKLTRSSSMSLI